MIRNVILHLNGEQPLIADLFEAPTPGDVGVRCTNLRQLNGKRPVFVDDMASIFFFPYLHMRFVEIPPASLAGGDASSSLAIDAQEEADLRDGHEAEPEADLEIDEDFLRRIREA